MHNAYFLRGSSKTRVIRFFRIRVDKELGDRSMGFLESRTKIILIFALTLLIVEEVLAVYIDPVLSLFVSFLGAFVTAILPYAVKWTASTKASLQCFSLVFLTRVAVAVVPALILPTPVLLIIVYSLVLVVCAVYAVERGLTANTLGFRFSNAPLQVFGGLAIGVAMGVTEFTILSSDMKTYLLFQGFSVANFVYVTVIMFLFVALGEELLFRGLVQASFEKEMGSSFAAILTVSSIFAIMHLGYVTGLEKILEIVYVFVAATVLGYAFMKTKSLVLPLIAHGTANTILFGILPYIV